MPISQIHPYEMPPAGSWPAPRAPWHLRAEKVALLVHDLQDYFLRPYDMDAAPIGEMLQNVRSLIRASRKLGIPIFFSFQPGEQSRNERGLLWDVWGPGIVQAPELSGLSKALEVQPGDHLIPKRRYSAFFETNLGKILHDRGREQLLITGVYGHIGCVATATEGFMRGIQPFLVADAIGDFSSEDHLTALRQVARTCGVVIETGTVLEQFSREAHAESAPLVAGQSSLK